jgi:hypothetical protein
MQKITFRIHFSGCRQKSRCTRTKKILIKALINQQIDDQPPATTMTTKIGVDWKLFKPEHGGD